MNGINKKNIEPSGLVPLSEVIAAADNVKNISQKGPKQP